MSVYIIDPEGLRDLGISTLVDDDSAKFYYEGKLLCTRKIRKDSEGSGCNAPYTIPRLNGKYYFVLHNGNSC
ncbi:MAG: hypothetical protein GF368_04830 [Candidatus Aenigmarchaeota archaeon]|nr:hypothetical protein [Candidatus Aenigmarchaeota archaeon]